MSSILKALKKLEEEKKAPIAAADRVSRDDESFLSDARRSQKNLWLLGIGILVGLAAAGGWMYWAGESPEEAPTAQGLVKTDSGPPAADTLQQPAGAAAIGREEQGGTPAAVVEVRVPQAEPVQALTPDPTAATDDIVPAADSSLRSDSQPDTAGTESSLPPLPATVSASAGSTETPGSGSPGAGSKATAPSSVPFQVMEVFYQDGEGSMALVDDLPVMEGTVINGALVEKILPDRVRFIVDGRPVEVFAEQPQP